MRVGWWAACDERLLCDRDADSLQETGGGSGVGRRGGGDFPAGLKNRVNELI
jgi:hypothetical protein